MKKTFDSQNVHVARQYLLDPVLTLYTNEWFIFIGSVHLLNYFTTSFKENDSTLKALNCVELTVLHELINHT